MDSTIPDANDVLLSKTHQSVQEWEDKITQYTGNSKWNFEFKIVSSDNENDESTKTDCNAHSSLNPHLQKDKKRLEVKHFCLVISLVL